MTQPVADHPHLVKFTPHFLRQARAKGLPDGDALALWRFILHERIQAVAASLGPGEKGALSTGSRWIIFCRDRNDPDFLTLVTVLRKEEGGTIQRRRDTRMVNLPDVAEALLEVEV